MNRNSAPLSNSLTIRHLGPLITDTSIPGERKCDGSIPAHPGGGAIQVARDRWIIFFATLDPRGWDANRSIVYQLRRGAPDGPIVTEGTVSRCRDDWDPLSRGERLFKSCGMPIAFGVPKGAVAPGAGPARPLASANVFVVKWYRWAHLPRNGRLVHANNRTANEWPDGLSTRDRTLRVEWTQFRLNADESDIELLIAPSTMTQLGYPSQAVDDPFCSLGGRMFMNHSMRAPVPQDDTHTSWIEFGMFCGYDQGRVEHGGIAAVRFQFNPMRGLYEWTETGALHRPPGRLIGESSANRIGDQWIVAARSFDPDGATCWYRTQDPLAPLPDPVLVPNREAPRMAFLCADGVLRLFTNPENDAHCGMPPGSRNPLCVWDVDPVSFAMSNRRTIVDAREAGMPFQVPLIDMCKLCPNQGRRQLLLYRVITRRQTSQQDLDRPITATEHEMAGIYCAEIVYDHDVPEPWRFDDAVDDGSKGSV